MIPYSHSKTIFRKSDVARIFFIVSHEISKLPSGKLNHKRGARPLRLSPRLDNFYEKIGVKTLVLLYPIVGRLQVPK